MDYKGIGLKVGIEIHQELKTEHKLFCACPPKLFKGNPDYTFVRRLRPSQSELGEIDPAALFEFRQGKTIVYEADSATSCLVEMDEEPPGPLNDEALDISLTVALMTGSNPVDEVHVMRKTVVDGSNTTGFQRTCVVSLGGAVEARGRAYRLEQICLEEDAARKIADEGMMSRFRIDRLGIPLIEVSTAPDVQSPEEAKEVALAIGRMLRSTGRVRRGLGTIRQDLNVSISGGAIIEIKGVQELELISKVVEYEAQRQMNLLEIASELQRCHVKEKDPMEDHVDVSDLFTSTTKSQIIQEALKKGRRVMALRLPGFGGYLGKELCPNRRLGTEMADRAQFWGGVRGIFHTDELPGYGISMEEVSSLKKRMGASEQDAVVIVADEPEKCRNALAAVEKRAEEALLGVPSETRAANPDGTTHFTRPRPGAARMYPETDVMSISITSERLGRLRSLMPEMPEARLKRMMAEYKLNEKLAKQVQESDFSELFEKVVKDMGVSPTLVAITLTETMRSLAREGCAVENLDEKTINDVFSHVKDGTMVKEAIPDVLRWLSKNVDASPRKALKALNLETIPKEELRRIVDLNVENNSQTVEKLGEGSMGPLMGILMSKLRGRAAPEAVQALLKEAVRSAMAKSKSKD